MQEMNLRNYAYLGDAVWELFVREITVELTENSRKLHDITTAKVKGEFQAELLNTLDLDLTDEEKDIARRGRNLPIPVGRRQNQGEYRQATAFETLIGYWYCNDKDRLNFFLAKFKKDLVFLE